MLWIRGIWCPVSIQSHPKISCWKAKFKCSCPLQSGKKYARSSDNGVKIQYRVVDVYPFSPATRAIKSDDHATNLRTTNGKGRSSLTFLDLPGEIRNQIYHYVLVSDRSYAVQLQFNPLDTAILRLNRQIFAEASGIFYHENCFRFPQALFIGRPILAQLESFYRVSQMKLLLMRNFIFEIPVSKSESVPLIGVNFELTFVVRCTVRLLRNICSTRPT